MEYAPKTRAEELRNVPRVKFWIEHYQKQLKNSIPEKVAQAEKYLEKLKDPNRIQEFFEEVTKDFDDPDEIEALRQVKEINEKYGKKIEAIEITPGAEEAGYPLKIDGGELAPPTDPERMAYEKRVQAIEEEIRKIDAELKALEQKEKIETPTVPTPPTERPTKPPKRISRRSFLASIGLAAGAATAAKVISEFGKIEPAPRREKDVKLPNIPEQRGPVEKEIAKAVEIIRNKKYDEVLKTPYLVSALYYSPEAIGKMRIENPLPSEEIIGMIYYSISPAFREGYIAYLKNKIAEHREKFKREGRKVEVRPLDSLGLSKDLSGNHLDAVDIFIKEGSPIYSSTGGMVVLAENGWKEDNDLSTTSRRGGNTVIVFNPENDSFYRYAHMQETRVTPGVVISAKDIIGVVGHSGINASKPGHGDHLHYEINRYDRNRGEMVPQNVFELKERLEKSL